MKFLGTTNEYLELCTIEESNESKFTEIIKDGLTIIWGLSGNTRLIIDGVEYSIGKNQLVFLTEFHKVEVEETGTARLVRFNRSFYCIIDHDAEVGCKGILFFGASQVPVVEIPVERLEKFEVLWKMFSIEMESSDELQFQMLQMMLKRFIILCTRLAKEQNDYIWLDHLNLDIIREFNFLVETHFREKHSVAEYAGLLHKSPKTLSNLFSRFHDKTPLQIIQQRILLEGRRLLRYTRFPVKEIAYKLGFDDIQSFSRFFKLKEGCSPTAYRMGDINLNPGRIDNHQGKTT
ncbi:MAG TPA: AraC family transcriptional regulator [Balneolales bacterium]|nr:AraC family transcriptional regulator [Balneolales bacterium]HYW94849.1 AraC family transcriptional regulator [Bacteroidales bacterium]